MDRQTKKKYLILLIIIFCVFAIKISNLQHDLNKLNRIYEGDLNRYLVISQWIIGQPQNETPQQYQYPPLYAIILIPALHMDFETYIIVLNVLLAVLTIIPLWLIAKRYINEYMAMILAGFIIMVDLIFSIVSVGFPIVFSALLFAWFTVFFIDAYENKKTYWMSAIFFALLIATKYVFLYMLPFIITWMLLQQRYEKLRIKLQTITLWGLPAILVFLGWSLRNMALHGISLTGILGGYSSLTKKPLAIYFDMIPSKLLSIPHTLMPNTLINYYLIFIITTTLVWIYSRKNPGFINKYYPNKDKLFHYLLILNFVVFFCLPAMTYNRWFLNWRYISYFTPVYLTLSFVLVTIFLTEFIKSRKSR